MASLLIVSTSELATELSGTVLWRDEVRRDQVADRASVVAVAGAQQPNLILVDGREPSAPELVEQLRADPRTRALAIAVLQPGTDSTLEDRLREAGANVVLCTPVDPGVWDDRLQRLLSVARRRAARLPVELQVWSLTSSDRQPVEAVARDISVRGMLLETAEPFELGRKLDLRMRFPGSDREIEAVGQVARRADGEGQSHLLGVSFLVLRGDARERIRRFVETAADATAAADPAAERREWEEALRTSELLRSAVVESARDAIVGIDAEGRIVEFNRAAEAIFGRERDRVLGRAAAELLVPAPLRQEFRQALARQMASGAAGTSDARLETSGMRADGSEFPAELTALSVQLSGRRVFTGFVRDITEEHRREAALRESQATQRALFATLPDMVLRIRRDGTYLDYKGPPEARPSVPPERLLGRRIEEVHGPELAALAMPHVERAFVEGTLQTFEHSIAVDGQTRYREVRLTAISPDEVLAIVRDITEHKAADERIRTLAYRDSLTSLPNRVLFRDRLDVALAQAHRNQRRPSVLMIALDRFKLINESLGPAFGDLLLRAVADRLAERLRDGDTVARLGGDEFAMLLPDVAFAMDAARVAGKVQLALRQPFPLHDREMHVSASIGVAVFPDDGENADALVKNAEAAKYRAKERGRDRYEMYAPAMNESALERLALETNLRRALSHGVLELYYQPVIDGGNQRILGFEALLRWPHPEGFIPPSLFVPIAEAVGLVLPMGAWAMREACAQGQRWLEEGHEGLSMAVNLSPLQFQQPDLELRILTILQETGFSPRALHLEITESSAMQNPERTVGTLRRLKSLGVHVSIDDFGVGYSSLNYLRRLPIDTLKIDQSFVRDIREGGDAPIVSTVISMARNLGLEVVAEGVETEPQRSFLSRSGCRQMQGFLFSPARPSGECSRMLEHQQAAS